MTPAALRALLEGDLENAVVASIPGGIAAQEKQGQTDQLFVESLPVDGTSTEEQRTQFESMGFVFELDRVAAQNQGGKNIFVNVKFPEGWRKKATDHSMWTELRDNKDRVRGMIFFKAAFYDYNAHIRLSCRFGVSSTQYKTDSGPVTVYVEDQNKQITKEIQNLKRPDRKTDPENWTRDYDAARTKEAELGKWLDTNYPDWRNPTAYWE